MGEHDDSLDDVVLDLSLLTGAWANSTRVLRGRDEITVDFLLRVPDRPQRILVARALVSPLVAVELRDQLDESWRDYSEWSMPEDPHG
jgi:hypothetical protein